MAPKPDADRYVLFSRGGYLMAVALSRVRRVAEAGAVTRAATDGSPEGRGQLRFAGQPLTLAEETLPPRGTGAPGGPEALVVIEEKGLTAGFFVDKIIGIQGGQSVRRHAVPARIASFCSTLDGLVEVEGELYLLVDVDRVLGVVNGDHPLTGGREAG